MTVFRLRPLPLVVLLAAVALALTGCTGTARGADLGPGSAAAAVADAPPIVVSGASDSARLDNVAPSLSTAPQVTTSGTEGTTARSATSFPSMTAPTDVGASSSDVLSRAAPAVTSSTLGPVVAIYGAVTGGANVRSGPSTEHSVVGHLAYRESVRARLIQGVGWYQIDEGRYIAASVVSTTRPAPTPAAAPSTTYRPPPDHVITQDILAGVNAYRAQAGVPALQPRGCADSSALAHSKAEAHADKMYHRTLDQIAAACHMSGGENVGYGYATAAAVLKGWWKSPGHRANILDARYRYMGAAVAYTPSGTPYYTQVFYIPAE